MGRKQKFKTFTSENVEIITAKKLQEIESSKTQSSASGVEKRSKKAQSKNSESGTSSSAILRTNNPKVKPTHDINYVDQQINLSQESSSVAAEQAHKHIVQSKEQNEDQAGAVDTKAPEPNLTIITTVQDNLGPVKETSADLPIIEPKSVDDPVQDTTVKVKSNTSTTMEPTLKDVQLFKPQPDNPAWISGTCSPPTTVHPFSSLNPNASEFRPIAFCGSTNETQLKTDHPLENNIIPPFPNPTIRKEITNQSTHHVPPGTILQTPVDTRDFQRTVQGSMPAEPPTMPSDSSPVAPIQDHRHSASEQGWEEPLLQRSPGTDDIKESVLDEIKVSSTSYPRQTVQDAVQNPSSTYPDENWDAVTPSEPTQAWPDEEYTEPACLPSKESPVWPSQSHSKNQRDFKNNDKSRDYQDRRDNKSGGGWNRDEKEHGRRTENVSYHDSDLGASSNSRNREGFQEGRELSRERVGRSDGFTRNNHGSRGSSDSSFRRGTTGRRSNWDNRGRHNRYQGPRDYPSQFQKDQNREPFEKRDDDTKQHFSDNIESLSGPQHESSGNKRFHDHNRKSDVSWRDRSDDDSNAHFNRDSGKFSNSKNARYPHNRGRDNSRGGGNANFRKDHNPGWERSRGGGRERYNNYNKGKEDYSRPSPVEAPEIVNDDRNYRVTDDDWGNVPEKSVELVPKSSEDTWGEGGGVQGADAAWDDWNNDVDDSVGAASGHGDWDTVQETADESKNQSNAENLPEDKETSVMSQRGWEQQPTRPREKVNTGGSRDSSYGNNEGHIRESESEKRKRSLDKPIGKDPRMDRERSNRSADSGNVSSQGSAAGSGGSRRSDQTRITSYSTGQDPEKEKSEKEFDRWERVWEKTKDFRVVREIQGNLFEQPKDFSLAHCVAEDLRMGSGIAVDFKRQFKNVPDLLDQRAKQGGLATLRDEENKRFVYYLVTKRESNGKPTYETVWRSLTKMRTHITENEVKKLAIPRLACGLDRLEWNKVKSMIEHLFTDVAVDITVCNFQQDEEMPKRSITCRLVVEEYPITQVEANTLIFYFSTEEGDVDDNMREMSKKFNFLSTFQNYKSKKSGEIVYSDDKDYGFCGCFVRKTIRDKMSFKSLAKCVQEFNKMNKKLGNNAFTYVAFQWVNEKNYLDDLINQKIITVLINLLRNVDVYVCRGYFDATTGK